MSAPVELTPLDQARVGYVRGRGLERFEPLLRVGEILLPEVERNPWLEDMERSLLEEQWVCWAGCAGSGKTFGASFFAVKWWSVWPEESSVILVSTTKGMIRKRAWGFIQGFHSSLARRRMAWGNLVDSKTTWQSRKGDDKNAIFAVAVEDGSVSKAVDNIKGVHTRRQLVIVDEATSVPEAIFEACGNLYSTPEEFILLVIGNPWSRFDEMGKFAEPASGWNSVGPDTVRWRTRQKLNGRPGLCVRFDAERSPNALHGNQWPYLVREETLRGAREALGANSPRFWSEYRGFWPLEGLENTVLSEVLLTRMGATDAPGEGDRVGVRVAGFDPAFGGGDRAILRFGWVITIGGAFLEPTISNPMGIVTAVEGTRLVLDEEVHIEVDALSPEPITYQLGRRVMEECKKRGVLPKHFAMDANAQGSGVADFLTQEWGPIIRVVGPESPTEEIVSLEDERPANEVYRNRITELWFRIVPFVKAGQVKGLGTAAAQQLCQRRWDQLSRKIFLEEKREFKLRMGRSPDEADATVLTVEAARAAGLKLKGLGKTAAKHSDWNALVAKADGVYHPDSLYSTDSTADLTSGVS